jgi:hypothetical protein
MSCYIQVLLRLYLFAILDLIFLCDQLLWLSMFCLFIKYLTMWMKNLNAFKLYWYCASVASYCAHFIIIGTIHHGWSQGPATLGRCLGSRSEHIMHSIVWGAL